MTFDLTFDVVRMLTGKWKSAGASIVLSLLLLAGCGGKEGGNSLDSSDQPGQVRQLAEGLSPTPSLQRAPTPDSIASGITEDLQPPTVN